jgi:hypothetical protein
VGFGPWVVLSFDVGVDNTISVLVARVRFLSMPCSKTWSLLMGFWALGVAFSFDVQGFDNAFSVLAGGARFLVCRAQKSLNNGILGLGCRLFSFDVGVTTRPCSWARFLPMPVLKTWSP